MQRHLYCTQKPQSLKSRFFAILRIVQCELQLISPFLKRKNSHLLHQSDAHILSLHLLGKWLGFTSERAWHRLVQGDLGSIIERSRYHRRMRDLRYALKRLRKRLTITTNIHVVVDELGYFLLYALTGEQCHESRIGYDLLQSMPLQGTYVIADRAYDTNRLLQLLEEQQVHAVIPSRDHRTTQRSGIAGGIKNGSWWRDCFAN